MKKGIIILSIVCIFLFSFGIKTYLDIKKEKEAKLKIERKIEEVKSHYDTFVKTTKETILYEDGKEIGMVNKDVTLELEDINIDENTKYFKIKDLGYEISYQDLEKTKEKRKDDKYKRYVLFNQNVVGDNITLYQQDNYVYKLNISIDTPLIIKDTDKYYIEYENELYYVKKEDVTLKNHENTKEKVRNNIRTFTYHAVFKEGETCKNDAICHPYKQFDSHMKYLAENNYVTLTMEELELFLDKKIRIPKKTVVLTLDDGNLAKNAIEILDKYKLYATYFIITGRYDSYKLKSDYVSFECHSDNLHNNYKCPGGEQGGQLLCEKEDIIKKDLELSKEKLGGSKYFSYPFFDVNERAKRILKESGFHLAFIGQWQEDGYSTYDTDRFRIRRKTIFAQDSLETFKSYLD